MNKRIATAVLALVLMATLPGRATHTPDSVFQYIADRIETILLDLVGGRTTAARAAAEIDDLRFIAAAAQLAFADEIRAAGGGNTLTQAIAGLQNLLASAAEALARNGSGDLQEAFLVRLGTAGQVTSALTAALRGGFSNITTQQLASLQGAAPGTATAVRAPDYRAPIAQDSIATVFTSRAVASSTATASFDANRQLPNTLAGVTILVGGRLAPLLYASANQVNFLMPTGLPLGATAVVVAGNNGAVTGGAVELASAAPAIFTENATGRGEGAILNGATFRRGPFALTTPENPGDDKRTRLAVFLTGIRNLPNTNAGNDLRLPDGSTLVNVAESVTATIGGSSVPVEFAGRHPVFLGLDQVNVILPADFTGRGALDLAVRAGALTSNTVQVTIQ